jgi:hypothetical protein
MDTLPSMVSTAGTAPAVPPKAKKRKNRKKKPKKPAQLQEVGTAARPFGPSRGKPPAASAAHGAIVRSAD